MKKVLKSNREIAEYIESHSSYSVDTLLIEECFFGCEAILKEVDISSLLLDNEDHHILDEEKQEKYNKMKSEEAPPIVVEKGVIRDGHHRVRAAKYQNKQTIMAYVVVEKKIIDKIEKKRYI